MSLNPAVKSRICSTKVKTGCLTCKKRRLKCDELKPTCTRCLKSGRACLQASSEQDGLKMVHYVPGLPCPPSDLPGIEEFDRWYLHRFRTKTAIELAGVYCPEIWLRHTVYIALSEPAIRHALVALTALQQQFEQTSDMALAARDIQYPLRRYTEAINSLTISMQTARWTFPDTPLIACMLFCAFESMCYHLDSAISHISSGLKILLERQGHGNELDTKFVPPALLGAAYTMLDTQTLELGEESLHPLQRPQYGRRPIRVEFESVSEALQGFDELVNSMMHTMHKIDLERSHPSQLPGRTDDIDVMTTFDKLVVDYQSWCNCFDRFVKHRELKDWLPAFIKLQLTRILLNINLQVDLREGEVGFDRFTLQFQAIVDLATEFVLIRNHSKQRTSERTPQPRNMTDGYEELVVYHCDSDNNSLRGGHLSMHPCSTPFVSDGILDSAVLKNTTQLLLAQSRSRRKATLVKEGKPETELNVIPDMQPTYTFSPGIVSNLYVTISRCRDPNVRRQALHLMSRCKRREGLWDSELATRLGGRVVQIEEQRALEIRGGVFETSSAFGDVQIIVSAEQIPNEARVRMIKPTFLPDRRSIERYYLGWPGRFEDADEGGETWIEELMEW